MAKSTPDAPDNRKRGMRWDWVFLALVLFVLFSYILQRCGINVVKQTDDSEIIDKPHRD